MNSTSIAIGSDHRGFGLKNAIIDHLTNKGGYLMIDLGAHSEVSTDYPEFAHSVATTVESGDAKMGIVICGTGNGVAITANKHKGIRCGLCWTKEIAALVRQHNDANIIAIPAAFVDQKTVLEMIDVFVNTEFEGGRHARRVDKICI